VKTLHVRFYWKSTYKSSSTFKFLHI
jgi:hypothetical protein